MKETPEAADIEFRAAPNDTRQVLRFGVGSADGNRSRTWRLWVEPNKSDVYISGRTLGAAVKVSLHEPGPSRFALTREHIRRPDGLRLPAENPRGAHEWERPRPQLPETPMTRAFAILVPWDEVTNREGRESGEVIWTPPPPSRTCVEYDVMYAAQGLVVEGYPGRRSMGTRLIGKVNLANGEQVFVVAWAHEMDDGLLAEVERLRSVTVTDNDGERVSGLGVLAFGVEEGVGVFLDVTPPAAAGE